MDLVLHYADEWVFDYVYEGITSVLAALTTTALGPTVFTGPGCSTVASAITGADATLCISRVAPFTSWLDSRLPSSAGPYLNYLPDLTSRDDACRQLLTLLVITTLFGHVLYYSIATLSFRYLFDHRQLNHPRFLPNQIKREMTVARGSLLPMSLLTVPWFFFEIRGYSRVYSRVEEYGWTYLFVSIGLFLLLTDMMIYWVHRGLHSRLLYGPVHKLHHKWIVPTPYASHAFHFLDGYFQSVPYHVTVFLIPLHKILYLVLFTFVNIWAVLIHDGEYLSNDPFINGAAHHTVHHEKFNYNYGQYFTLWDRIGGTYCEPGELVTKRAELLKSLSGKTE